MILIGVFILVYQSFELIPFSRRITSGDMWEFYHDYFYRMNPFDYRVITLSKGSSTYYQPLANVFFNLLYPLALRFEYLFYFFGVMIHCINASLVYGLSRILKMSAIGSIITCSIFMLHPFNVRMLTHLPSILTHPILTLFLILSVILFLQYLTRGGVRFYLGSLICLCLACLVKIYALILIPVFMLFEYDFASMKKTDKNLFNFIGITLRSEKYIPFAMTAISFIAIAIYKHPRGAIAHDWGDISFNLFSLLRFCDYVTCLFFSFLIRESYSLFYVLLVFGALSWIFIFGNFRYRIYICWLALSFLFFVFSNYNPIHQLVRYFYVASIPMALMIGEGVTQMIRVGYVDR